MTKIKTFANIFKLFGTGKFNKESISSWVLLFRGPVLFIFVAGLLIFAAFQVQPFTFNLDIGPGGDSIYVANFYAPEENLAFDYRWSKDTSYVNLYQVGTPYKLTFRAVSANPAPEPVRLTITANGQEIGQATIGQAPEIYTVTSSRPVLSPEDLTLILKVDNTFDEPGQVGRKKLGIALDWIKIEPYRNHLGLIIPPPFQWGWWVLFSAWPLLLIRISTLKPRHWKFYLAGGFNLTVAGTILALPATARQSHTDWFITGLAVEVLELGGLLAWLAFKQWQANEKDWRKFPKSGLFLLLVALGLLYLASYHGRLSYGDDQIMEGVTAAIVSGNPAAPLTRFLNYADIPTFAPYGIGLPLVAVPFYLLGVGVSKIFPAMHSEVVGFSGLAVYLLLLTNLLLTLGSVAFFYRILRRLNFNTGPALLSAVLYGGATMAWHYARTFLSEPLVTFCLLAALFCSLNYRQGGTWKWSVLAGFMLGLAVATRLNNLIVLPFFGLYLLWAWWERENRLKGSLNRPVVQRAMRDGASFIAGLGFWLFIINWYNTARFNSATATGGYTINSESFDTPLWTGLYGQLFSTGKSIFLYNPVLVLGIIGLPFALRWQRGFTLLCLGLIAAYLTLYGTWLRNGWLGGGVWGLRFLVPLLPLFLWPATYLFAYVGRRGPARLQPQSRLRINWLKTGVVVLTLVLTAGSLVVQFLSIMISYQIYEAQYGRTDGLFQRALYNLADSPIVVHWNMWWGGTRPDLASRFYHETPFARWVVFVQDFALWGALGCVLLAGLVWLLKIRANLDPLVQTEEEPAHLEPVNF